MCKSAEHVKCWMRVEETGEVVPLFEHGKWDLTRFRELLEETGADDEDIEELVDQLTDFDMSRLELYGDPGQTYTLIFEYKEDSKDE